MIFLHLFFQFQFLILLNYARLTCLIFMVMTSEPKWIAWKTYWCCSKQIHQLWIRHKQTKSKKIRKTTTENQAKITGFAKNKLEEKTIENKIIQFNACLRAYLVVEQAISAGTGFEYTDDVSYSTISKVLTKALEVTYDYPYRRTFYYDQGRVYQMKDYVYVLNLNLFFSRWVVKKIALIILSCKISLGFVSRKSIVVAFSSLMKSLNKK